LACAGVPTGRLRSNSMGRGLLLWLLGIPLPIILLLWVFHVI
jgi:hypothetical protein